MSVFPFLIRNECIFLKKIQYLSSSLKKSGLSRLRYGTVHFSIPFVRKTIEMFITIVLSRSCNVHKDIQLIMSFREILTSIF